MIFIDIFIILVLLVAIVISIIHVGEMVTSRVLGGGMVGGVCDCFACIWHVSHGQDFVCGLLSFGNLCYSLKSGDKEVGLGDGHVGFHW